MRGLEELKAKLDSLWDPNIDLNKYLTFSIPKYSHVKVPILYVKMASKGDTIFGTPIGWVITDIPFKVVQENLLEPNGFNYIKSMKLEVTPLVYNHDRKYILARAIKLEGEVEQKEVVREVVEGFEFPYRDMLIAKGTLRDTELLIKYRVIFSNGELIKYEIGREWLRTAEREDIKLSWKNDSEVRTGVQIFDPVLGVRFKGGLFGKELKFFKGITRADLRRISKAFVVAYPEVRYAYKKKKSSEYHLITIYRVFYDGKEYEIPVYEFTPAQLEFRITTRRFALSKHYRNTFGVNIVNASPEEFIKALHYLKDIDYEGIKVRDLSEYERFAEMFFVRTPERKFAHIQEFMKAADLVKKLIPESDVTLYVTFILSKKNKNKNITYPAFRYKPGEGIRVVQTPPPVRVTSIAVRGKFEKEYVEHSGIRKLMQYQFAPVQKKLEILRNDIEALREIVRTKAGKELSELHPEREIVPLLRQIATNGDNTANIALLIAKQASLARKVPVPGETLLKLAGLLKSGKKEDYTKERLEDVLRFARIAVKYEIKSHSYSSKLGVLFCGSPNEIVQNVLKLIKKIPERVARFYAMVEEVEKEIEEISKAEASIEASARISALT